ncbi:DMT family transporter [Agrococcus jejuensis]|uniref:DMT family transporter n=1 Tax=Agrococcus jejuensis TaxID=399736 RepID=UPI00119CFD2C|nr:SMR family transporter [Agrococcus jejuensis]
MDWVILVVSGLLEAVWATALSRTKGFTRWKPTVVFGVAIVGSMVGLAIAMLTIPTGTAYAVWVGIGAVTTAVWAMVTKAERATVARVVLLAVLVGCVVGLKVVA